MVGPSFITMVEMNVRAARPKAISIHRSVWPAKRRSVSTVLLGADVVSSAAAAAPGPGILPLRGTVTRETVRLVSSLPQLSRQVA